TAEARKRLGLPVADTVLLHVGFIRPYKNVPHLIRTFRRLPESGMRLLIGGQPATAALRAEIEAAARGDARIALDLGFLPAEQLTDYVAAADLVVLPYAEILNSGTALLALSLNRPVLVPALGALLELRDEVGPAWVQTYTGTLSPEVLRQAAIWARDTPRPAEAPLSRRAWPHLARQTVEAYRWLCTR
ncbi:MAG: glycosyltransferase, partial [Bacteroidetes bacterium]